MSTGYIDAGMDAGDGAHAACGPPVQPPSSFEGRLDEFFNVFGTRTSLVLGFQDVITDAFGTETDVDRTFLKKL